MKMVALGEVATIERSGVDPSTLPPHTTYLGLEHIERGGRIIGRSSVAEAELASTKFRFSADHVLFGKLRPNLGKISRPDFDGVCSTDILPIRPGRDLDRGYLAHYLSQPSMVDFAASRTSGANLPRLSPTVLAQFPIPLPPLPEQRRIAAILDSADALRAKRRQVLAYLDALTQSIFHDMFAAAPGKATPLGEVADLFGGASLPAGEAFRGQTKGTLLMKVSDMNAPGNEDEVRAAALWTPGSGTHSATVNAGAVVLPKRGASIATNKKRLTARRTSLDPNLMGVQPRPTALASRYLYEWFKRFDLSTITSGSTVPQLNKQDLAPLHIPVPPLDVQLDFATSVEAVDRQRSHVRRALGADDELFSSLQSRAFRGEL